MQSLRDYICCGLAKANLLVHKKKKKNIRKIENNTLTEQELRDWSDLPHDIVILISSKISSPVIDIVSMKRVCSSWRIAMRNLKRASYKVGVPFCSPESMGNFVCIIINEKNERGPLVDDDVQYSGRLIGYRPDGWIITTDQLLHLFLNIREKLPIRTSVPFAPRDGLVLENCMSQAGIFTYSNEPNDFVVVMSYYDCYPSCPKGVKDDMKHGLKHDMKRDMRLACWYGFSPGFWFTFGAQSFVPDIAVCNDNKRLYAIKEVTYDYFIDKYVLEVWDFKYKAPPAMKLRIRLHDNYCDNYRLVQSLVLSLGEEIYVANYDCLSRCVIYKLDSCQQVNSLHGQTLLLSNFCDSIILSSIDSKLLYTSWKEKGHQASIVLEKIINLT